MRMKGEYDIVVFVKNWITVFEFKNKAAEVIGRTDQNKWNLKYNDAECFNIEDNYFIQVSKERKFLHDYLLKRFKHKYESDNTYKFRIDARLVFRNGSKFRIDFTQDRIKKWFKVIEMKDVEKELLTCGNDGIALTENDLYQIGIEFGLKTRDINEWYRETETASERLDNTENILRNRINTEEKIRTTIAQLSHGSTNFNELIEMFSNLPGPNNKDIDFWNSTSLSEYRRKVEAAIQIPKKLSQSEKAKNYRAQLTEFEYLDEYDDMVDAMYSEIILAAINKYIEEVVSVYKEIYNKGQRDDKLVENLFEINNCIITLLDDFKRFSEDKEFDPKLYPSKEGWLTVKKVDLLSIVNKFRNSVI